MFGVVGILHQVTEQAEDAEQFEHGVVAEHARLPAQETLAADQPAHLVDGINNNNEYYIGEQDSLIKRALIITNYMYIKAAMSCW